MNLPQHCCENLKSRDKMFIIASILRTLFPTLRVGNHPFKYTTFFTV